MSQASKVVKPEAPELPVELLELADAIGRLPTEPRHSLAPLLEQVIEGAKRRRRILGLVQDALSQLRLDMKYLMFDLEATRRERDEYRRKTDGGAQ